ncbi:MAG: hypothetical protein ACE5HJ_06570 [Thermoplasmata archaeon]
MAKEVQVFAELLKAILEEFSSIMGTRAAAGIAKRGASKVIADHRDVVRKKLKDHLPPEFLEDL